MNEPYNNIEGMSYEDFVKFCNDRACDGKWSMIEAMACLDIINTINKIKVKSFGFIPNKRKTKEAREKEWRKYNFKTIT